MLGGVDFMEDQTKPNPINPLWLHVNGWRFVPSRDRVINYTLQAVPEYYEHDELGVAFTIEDAAARQTAADKVQAAWQYKCIHVGPPPRKPSLLARLFSRVGQKRRGWSKYND
jgi:hypothetical protein